MKKQSAGRRVRREKIRRKKMQVREKVGKSRSTVFFRGFVAPEGWKVGSLKRRVRRHLGRWEMKSCTPLWREAHLEVKCVKNWGVRTTFGSCDVEKVHAVVARSTFPSQNVQNTPGADHFWHLRCRKSARRCGAKHISKSKCTKHTTFGPLLEVEMSKKCTPFWREAHFQVKMLKALGVRTTFGGSDVEKVHAVVARSTFRSQNVKNTRGSDHFWRFRCRFAWQAQGILHLVKSEQNVSVLKHFQLQPPLHHTTLQYITLHYNYNYTFTTFYYTTLHYTTLPSATLHYITLHYTPQHYNYNYTSTLHYTKLHSTTLNYTALHYTTLHSTTLHYTTRHYLPLHYTTLHYITLHSTALHYITLHDATFYTSLHYTTLHSTTLQLQLHHYTPLHFTTLNYTILHYITLHYTPLHYTTLHYTTLPSTTLHYITLRYTPLHYNYSCNYNYTPLNSTTLNYTTLLHDITLHSTTVHYITLRKVHWMTLHHR